MRSTPVSLRVTVSFDAHSHWVHSSSVKRRTTRHHALNGLIARSFVSASIPAPKNQVDYLVLSVLTLDPCAGGNPCDDIGSHVCLLIGHVVFIYAAASNAGRRQRPNCQVR